MKKTYLLFTFYFLLFAVANAATPPPPVCGPIASIFSTSSDWEAVTGLRLAPYDIWFGSERRTSSIGTEIYYLDGFPCYGQTENVRIWVGPTERFFENRDARMSVTCLLPPTQLVLAWREADSRATQARTRGIMTCDVEQMSGRLIVRLENCEHGDDWNKITQWPPK
ncbi:MAG: hypothetical protein FWE52_02665 [Alphaproteobacteria bacterium]|nr:hypothetical protein [Alphaproteobacteria bacterium]